jgi:hypothetical protein
MQQEKQQKILDEILRAIYWRKFTPKQEAGIVEILNEIDITEATKANEICNLLDIEKRQNRSAITKVLLNAE